MPDNTNVNNNAAVVVVGRTAPVPPGQQRSEKSIPVVIASDQTTLPVAEQNKVQSEVALSLLGIPRSEVALGIFADVNTYDVNPTEWTSEPEQFSTVDNTGAYTGIGGSSMGWGLSHVPEESGALVEAPADKTAVLTSKRFFRYQPGRVSSATFGVKTTLINRTDAEGTGAGIQNPAVRKYGIFDNFDGYYWETRNNGDDDNFCVVRRTQSLIYENPVSFDISGQTEDYGRTNPSDPLEARGSESDEDATALQNSAATPKKFGDLVILRDNLMMTHAGVYDPSLLQNETKVGITTVSGGDTIFVPDIVKNISNAVYDIDTGLMVVTTSSAHGYERGKYITLSGIAMTCYLDPVTPKSYPNRTLGYNVLQVNSTTSFTVNVGVSTVPTYYVSGGTAVGLTTGQYVSYKNDSTVGVITGFTDTGIYRVASVNSLGQITLNKLDGTALNGLTNGTYGHPHNIVTPVPFVQPTNGSLITSGKTKYTTVKATGMFPYYYEDGDGNNEGYVDTTASASTLKDQIDDVNDYYDKWVNQNVAMDYWNVYEYRVPRSRFSSDRLDAQTDTLIYSDAVGSKRAGDVVLDENTNEELTDTSIWELDFTKVTMYKIEFSWYGAVGALFLAYVPVSNDEARWVRVHHLRASNQLKVSSLGNATLPITYMVYGGGNENRNGYTNSNRGESTFSYGSASEHIVKYGASYYIDGGDRGTVKLFSYSTPTSVEVYGSKRTYTVNNGGGTGVAVDELDLTNATSSTDPYMIAAAGISSSFFVGSKVITTNPLDQNIEINYVDARPGEQRLYLNSRLNENSLSSITVLLDRKTPLLGLKCKDQIQSSTGKNVRNRTQVYPTRLSTGSDGVVKLDLLKSPIFQTTSIVTSVRRQDDPILTSTANLGKRGKPTQVGINTVLYAGTHQFVSATANGITRSIGGTITATDADYDPITGVLTITSNSHGLSNGNTVTIAQGSLTFTCSLDNYATEHSYPRTTDPTFGQNLTVSNASTNTFDVNVGQAVAEYIRDIGTGTYGYFRGYYQNDPTQKPISVLGFLENRGSDRTKDIETDGYYFYALESTSDNIILTTNTPFLREDNHNSLGNVVTSTSSEFSLAQLSSIKINPQIRSPIPGTGTPVASIYIPASGEEYDLTPYFDYNKEYLSFPLTNKVDSLYLCASSSSTFGIGSTIGNVSASLTWEEQ